MAYATYQGIVNAIADNLGKDSQSSLWLRIVKDDIFSEMCKIYRKTKPIKSEYTVSLPIDTTVITSGTLIVGRKYTINTYVSNDDFANVADVLSGTINTSGCVFRATGTTPTHWLHSSELAPTDQEVGMPSTFYLPLEVIFFDGDGNQYPSKEIPTEEYMRWNPEVTLSTESFNDIITASTPLPTLYTQENYDLDGLVGYYFADSNPTMLRWKPSVTGSMKVIFATYPSIISALTASPDIHTIFQDLIVLGVTIQHLTRRLTNVKDQNELFGLQAALTRFTGDYKETLNDFNAYVNVNVSTPLITPFDILNDSSMLILKR